MNRVMKFLNRNFRFLKPAIYLKPPPTACRDGPRPQTEAQAQRRGIRRLSDSLPCCLGSPVHYGVAVGEGTPATLGVA